MATRTANLATDNINDGESILCLAKELRFAERCNCPRCQDWMQHGVGLLDPYTVNLARNFLAAPLSLQLSALFEDWTLDKIASELSLPCNMKWRKLC